MSPVLSDSEGWAYRKKIAYRQPVGWVLLGVFGEGSGWNPDEVYIWSLVMPLFIESEHLILSYSHRVANARTFGLGEEDAFRGAVASAAEALPSEDEALRQIAAGTSEASAGARVLLEHRHESSAEVEALRAVRTATTAALGIR